MDNPPYPGYILHEEGIAKQGFTGFIVHMLSCWVLKLKVLDYKHVRPWRYKAEMRIAASLLLEQMMIMW